jgi:hypothetical protein
MKTTTATPAQRELNEILEQAREDDIVLETADGSQFVISAVDSGDGEIVRTRNNRELMTLLEESARQPATIPLEGIERELGLA